MEKAKRTGRFQFKSGDNPVIPFQNSLSFERYNRVVPHFGAPLGKDVKFYISYPFQVVILIVPSSFTLV